MDNETRSQKRTLIILIVAVVVVILIGLTLAYCVMASHHKGRFPDKTYINGVDVSGMTAQRAKNELADEEENYTLTIEERGGTTAMWIVCSPSTTPTSGSLTSSVQTN